MTSKNRFLVLIRRIYIIFLWYYYDVFSLQELCGRFAPVFSYSSPTVLLPRGGFLGEHIKSETFLRHEEETVPGSDRVASEPFSSFLGATSIDYLHLFQLKSYIFTDNITGLWSPPSHHLRLHLWEGNEVNGKEELYFCILTLSLNLPVLCLLFDRYLYR